MSEPGVNHAKRQPCSADKATKAVLAWRNALDKVQAQHLSTQPALASVPTPFLPSDDCRNTPSILEQHAPLQHPAAPAPPRLAVMVHAATNLPGTISRELQRIGMYVKVAVHRKGRMPVAADIERTHPTLQADGCAAWHSLLTVSVEDPDNMMLTMSLRHKHGFTKRTVIWGVTSVHLSDVLANPAGWGEKKQLQLGGHRLQGLGALLEAQLFLSTKRSEGDLNVLAATWNVGNAMPPAPEVLLNSWLKGAKEGRYDLVAVAAQECNYCKEARRDISRHRSQSRDATSSVAGNSVFSLPEAIDAADPDKDTVDSDSSGETEALGLNGTEQPPDALKLRHCSSAPAATCRGTATAAKCIGHALAGPGEVQELTQDADDRDTSPFEAASAAAVVQSLDTSAMAPALLDRSSAAAELVVQGSTVSARARVRNYLLDQLDSAGMWERHIGAALGRRYWLVCSKHMYQTRLLVFARVDVVPYISHITSGFEATGIGHVGMNKGGVAASFKLDNTWLTFVCCHLAAHQSKTAQRNRDVAEICGNVRLSNEPAVARGSDLVTRSHHTIWMGDLNYRLEYGKQAVNHMDSPDPDDFVALCADIEKGQYKQLMALDQLRIEQEAGRVFAGFREGDISFAPTFKVLKGEPGFCYNPARSPAWCDRVLVKSALPHKSATVSSYYTAADIASSDHKPVAAELVLPVVTDTRTCGRSTGRLPIRLFIDSVKLVGADSWQALEKLLCLSGSSTAASNRKLSSVSTQKQQQKSLARHRKLQIVLSGACLAGIGLKHVVKVDGDAVSRGIAAAAATSQESSATSKASDSSMGASLLPREVNLGVLSGAVHDLQDDWLLLRIKLVEGLRSRTIARGIVPLQPAVAEYEARSFKPAQVPVHLESCSASAGTAVISLQIVSSSTARQGMYEAVRRMRALAYLRSHSTSDAETSSPAHAHRRARTTSDIKLGDRLRSNWHLSGKYTRALGGLMTISRGPKRASSAFDAASL